MTSIKILDSIKSIEKKVNKAIAQTANKRIKKNSGAIQDRAKAFAVDSLLAQPEIASLAGGELAGAFGMQAQHSVSAISAITSSFAQSIYSEVKQFSNDLKGGGVSIYFQPDSFTNLLNLSQGHTIYARGDLHWLQWLLERGDEIIVVGYEYEASTGRGRSGLGFMDKGGAFRVPPQFSGTKDNNFISRALIGKAQEQAISKILKDVLK